MKPRMEVRAAFGSLSSTFGGVRESSEAGRVSFSLIRFPFCGEMEKKRRFVGSDEETVREEEDILERDLLGGLRFVAVTEVDEFNEFNVFRSKGTLHFSVQYRETHY